MLFVPQCKHRINIQFYPLVPSSLGYGAILLIHPALFCELIDATAVNLSWLRTIGAALIGTNVVGSWLWLKSPNLDMGKVQLATAGLEAFAMTVSLILDRVHFVL